jgi:hypothetical protein
MTAEQAKETALLWAEMLSDVDGTTATAALKRLIATGKFPPSIAEVRENLAAVMYDAIPDAGDAWREVNQAIHMYGYYREAEALASMREHTRAAVKSMGWKQLCTAELDNDMADRAHFLKIYGTAVQNVEQERLIPAGLREQIASIAQGHDMTALLTNGRPEA